jgi:initiation factor 1A
MVKNTTGGTGTKSLARKSQKQNDNKLVLSENELEQYACVTKIYGNNMCEIYTNKNERLMGHIRNKFRGRLKRHNLVTIHSIVLVALRDYEKPYKNCDIMTIYNDNQIEQLRQIPSINIDHILNIRLTNSGAGGGKYDNIDNYIEFSKDATDFEPIVSSDQEEFKLDEIDEINIDDI